MQLARKPLIEIDPISSPTINDGVFRISGTQDQSIDVPVLADDLP